MSADGQGANLNQSDEAANPFLAAGDAGKFGMEHSMQQRVAKLPYAAVVTGGLQPQRHQVPKLSGRTGITSPPLSPPRLSHQHKMGHFGGMSVHHRSANPFLTALSKVKEEGEERKGVAEGDMDIQTPHYSQLPDNCPTSHPSTSSWTTVDSSMQLQDSHVMTQSFPSAESKVLHLKGVPGVLNNEEFLRGHFEHFGMVEFVRSYPAKLFAHIGFKTRVSNTMHIHVHVYSLHV